MSAPALLIAVKTSTIDNVEVSQGWLDHYHIRSFLYVQSYLTHGHFRVGVVHLVSSPISELGPGEGCLPKRSEKRGRVFRCICENPGILEPTIVKCFSNRGYLAVDHCGRSN